MEVVELGWSTVITPSRNKTFPELHDRLRRMTQELSAVDETGVDGTAAQEACFACLVLLETIEGKSDVNQVMRVVNFLRDITDMVVQADKEFASDDATLDEEILKHPKMVEELKLITGVLNILHGTLSSEIVEELKSLAASS